MLEFPRLFAGVDASSTVSGWGLVDVGGDLLIFGTVSQTGKFGPLKLARLSVAVRQALVEAYCSRIGRDPAETKPLKGLRIVVEMPSFFKKGGGKRARVAVDKGDVAKCAMAAGAVGAELVKAGAAVKFMKPRAWKGQWGKKAVLAWTRRRWPNAQFTDRKIQGPWGQDAMEGAGLAHVCATGRRLCA